MSTRVAAIDIGTNSVLLLVADARDGALVPVLERAEITRLGRGVDATRALGPDAVERTLACLASYAGEIERVGAARVGAVGTSAMRDARGGEGFRARAAALLGVEPQVISGDEEAALTFAGALSGLDLAGLDGGSAPKPPSPVLVFDLGGGSTELIRGAAGVIGTVERAVSLDVGSVRLTERHIRSDPPTADEIEAVRRDIRAALASLGTGWVSGAGPAPLSSPAPLVGVAGTVTTLAAYMLGVAPYDGARVHGARLSAASLTDAVGRLARKPLAERRGVPAIDPRRADVIVAGGILVEEILAWAGADELWVSDRGVRWGLAKRLAAAG
jgi:exopolyphosphatase / guanosine-5'-triphosphate,3'-diphosphate pyrophosphatase